MNRLLRPAALAILTLLAAAPLSAQGITGKWITEFDRMVRNDGGAISTGDKARARLTLAQNGDSVTGTWELLDSRAPQAKPRPLRGTISGDRVSLTAEFQATVNINGEESTRSMTVVYDFTIKRDALEGTMTTRNADVDLPPRPFTAVREKP